MAPATEHAASLPRSGRRGEGRHPTAAPPLSGVTHCSTPGCGHVASGALCGGCYARWVRGIPVQSRESVCAVPDCPKEHHSRGLCLTHYKRFLKGTDLSEPIHAEKRRGGTYVPRETGRQPMRPVLRPEESETLWSLVGNPSEGGGRSGGVHMAATWASENRQAEQLGTPQMWQQVADEALERAWTDLVSGGYERRLKARLAVLRLAKPKVVQSPLVGVVRPAGRSERVLVTS